MDKDVEEYTEKIETMLEDDSNRWKWAEETLRSILNYMGDTDRITDHQMSAVNNIKNSVEKK